MHNQPAPRSFNCLRHLVREGLELTEKKATATLSEKIITWRNQFLFENKGQPASLDNFGMYAVLRREAELRQDMEKLARKLDDVYAESIELDHNGDHTYVCSVLEHLDSLRNELARLAGYEDVTELYQKWQEQMLLESSKVKTE